MQGAKSSPNVANAYERLYRGIHRPPWDHDGASPFVVQLASTGAFRGRVLDAGCGTGEDALYLSSLGLHVTGFDAAPTAIERAEAKAAERNQAVEFVLASATEIGITEVGGPFDTVLDSGLFHCLDDAGDRACYAQALYRVCRPDARLHLWCFSSDVQLEGSRPKLAGCGTHGVSLRELEEAFVDGWSVESITAYRAELAAGPYAGQRRFWLARLRRAGDAHLGSRVG